MLLHELFGATASNHAGRVAVECADARLTYAELNARADELARSLRQLGVRTGDCVGMLLPRGIDVYVALLGILKAGAAYVPLDSEYPAERVCFILNDCQVSAIVTTRALLPKCQGVDASRLLVDEQRSHEQQTGIEPDRSVTETDLCYVIYTSGSTGKPKGVQIEHRSAVHLVEAERELFAVTPADRVYQGFSIAFDASVEEVWLAFRSGATLVAATEHMVRAGPDLPRLMHDAGITVLSCVPTLLAMMGDDIPSLRLLIVGGESCPADLVRRWAKTGRRMVNTYGPTEATVIATYGDVIPDTPVTIGKPVPGYDILIVDEQLNELLPGLPGEICIGAVALARGYVGRADLTAERFVQHASGRRLYRTGDLGRWTPDGEIEFLGRIDTQVKLRGFRIELAEIESAVMAHEGIRAAAVTVREDAPGIQQLVAYVVAVEGKPVDQDALRSALRKQLPTYMIPAVIESIEKLPTLTSGKVNRAALPAPKRPTAPPVVEASAARQTDTQRQISQYWCKAFTQIAIPLDAHFFTDLGGHSLLAATVVSRMRADERFRSLSVTDIYNHPTIAKLSGELDHRRKAAHETAATKPAAAIRVSNRQYRLCGIAQAVSMYLLYGLFAIQWITPYFTYLLMVERDYQPFTALAASMATLLLTNPIVIIVSIIAKWLIIGRFRAGDYPLWGWYYFRWWLAGQIADMTAISHFEGTPVLNAYYRLMGAKIGKHVHIGADNLSAYDLVTIGDHSTISAEGRICGETIEDGMLKLRAVTIGRDCLVGTRAVLAPGTSMADGSTLGEMSLLPTGGHIPSGQTWLGAPAHPTTHGYSARLPARHDDHPLPSWLCTAAHLIGGLLVPLVYILAIFPGMFAINYSYRHLGGHWYLLASPFAGVLFVAFVCLLILWLKASLLGRVKPGTCSLRSGLYLRKWFVDRLMDLSLEIIGPLYSTLYLNPWYSMLGAKLGKRAEISTACSTSPDLLEIGDESFTADAVSLGPATVDRGWMKMEAVKIGTRAFVGNSALIPGGTVVGNDSLVGVMTLPPAGATPVVPDNTSWLGSPAIYLPQRQQTDTEDLAHTYKPTKSLYTQRLIIEFFRIALPPSCFAFLGSLMIAFAVNLPQTWPMWGVLALFPILCMECGLMAALIVIAVKWILMGRYVPREAPLWSHFVWRTELLTALHENLANPFFGELIAGTPFAPMFFRMLGCQIGKRVYLDSTNLTEFDLISIGDEACICADSTLQTHLFEDRVMKMSAIEIGKGCVVGAESVVLYDTRMEDGSRLGEMSLLMKGESLPANTAWLGIPAQPADAAHQHLMPAKPAAARTVKT